MTAAPYLLGGTVALVTGGAAGIGAAIARGMAAAGARVAVFDVDKTNGDATAEAVRAAGARCLSFEGDVTREPDMDGAVAACVDEYGHLDVLVNSAAIVLRFVEPPLRPWDAWSAEEWDRYFAVNVRGAWNACRSAAPAMRRCGGGKIVNIASQTVFSAPPNLAPYTSSKAALVGLTRSLARELGPVGIRVNAITPGLVRTAQVRAVLSDEYEEQQAAITSLGRIAEPDDLVGPAVFLASELSRFVTGQVLNVDGGMVMH